MADAVSTRVMFSGTRKYAALFNNLSDGTGESAVAKIDISTLEGAPTAVRIMRVFGNVVGMAVSVLFDHTTDDTALILSGDFDIDCSAYGGIKDPGSSGGTGDILFTTTGHSSGDTYCIGMEVELV